MSLVSIYKDTFEKEAFDTDLPSILKAIANGKYQDQILKIRTTKDPDKKKQLKMRLPAFTTSGRFDGKKSETLIEHSNLIAMDFDHLGDALDDARSQLYADRYTHAGFVSVGGFGLCIIVKIEGKRHQDAFDALEKYYFTRYGYQADLQTRNVNRLRYLSYDPDLYHNPDSLVFREYLPKPTGRPKKDQVYITTNSDFDHVLSQIRDRRIDLTSDYDTWIRIGLAFQSHFGDAGLDHYQFVSQFHPDYDPVKTERKYRSFQSVKKIGIGTFYNIAKRAGLEIHTPQNKQIKQVALYARKSRKDKDEAIRKLSDSDGIAPEQAQPIFDAVYEAQDNQLDRLDAPTELVHALEDYIKREAKLRFNEVTHRYESDGKPMTDRDLNSLYLDARAILPKATKDLVKAVIESNRTAKYNPIHDWFGRNANRNNPIGTIDKLADSITPDRQSSEYVRKFIRYWMIGAVAMWHKYHSPLMLVLAGSRQNTGKSHFFRYLLPNDLQPYYAESYLTGDKDENIMMCTKIMIMNDEMSNKSKRDIAMIKDLCSKQWFNVRKPYGHTAEDLRRIAALAGTSNDLALLSDPSGNRRIIPINVARIDHDKYNSVDKTDLWVEAYNAFRAGEHYHLNAEDIRFLSEQTNDFKEPSAEWEGFISYFRAPEDRETPQYLTNTQIKAYIEARTKQRLSAKKLGMELKSGGFPSANKKINGNPVQVYAVVEITGIMIDKFLSNE